MLGLFKKKSEKEKLQSEYQKLMAQCHKLSTVDRKKSDQLYFEAHEIMKVIETLQ